MSGILGGGGGDQTQTTRIELPAEAQNILSSAQPFLDQFLGNVPQFQPFNLVPGFNPAQLQSQQSALGAAFGGQQDVANSALANLQGVLDPGFLNPSTNPALQATIDAAIRPLQQSFETSFLPGVRSEFEAAGQFGSSRQGVAEAIGQRDLNRQISDTSSSIAGNQFNNLLNAQLRGLGLAPTVSGLQTAPAQTAAAVGDVQQRQAAAELQQGFQNQQLEDFFPLLLFQNLVGTASQIPGGSTVATASQPQGNPLASALGGASTGFSLGGLPGAVIGGGLGFGSSFL